MFISEMKLCLRVLSLLRVKIYDSQKMPKTNQQTTLWVLINHCLVLCAGQINLCWAHEVLNATR